MPKDNSTEIQELQNTIQSLQSTVKTLQSQVEIINNTPIKLDRYLDNQSKEIIDSTISDSIHNVLWDNVSFTSSFATASITTTSPSTAELLDANGRESDTSGGKRFKPDRESRYRTSFYINSNLAASTIYITSPAISAVTTIGTAMVDADKSYVGVKIVNGAISMVSSVAGTETTVATTTTISDTSTNMLEIDYYVTHAVAKYNGTVIGDIKCNLLSSTTFATFFPFLISVKSDDGVATNLTTESYEFLQKRQ